MLKTFALALTFLGMAAMNASAQLCNANGNLIIYSSYDGGPLTINVDVNIPNLYIGVSSYEFCRIVITGAFANNVQAVWYAGYDADNNHCNLAPPLNTTITGVPAGITQIEFLPPANYIPPGAPNYIIYTYECNSDPGCGNNPEQITAYFSQMGPTTLRYHRMQYGCWSVIQNVSAGGNCCLNYAPQVFGCTDPEACNYNQAANADDGSCEYQSCAGCTDPMACNYDAAAILDDGSCFYAQGGGCTDPEACNYEANAAEDDGSCLYYCYGCLDAEACNYDPDATTNDGSCDYACLGCTYPEAANYDPLATRDDGSCDYNACMGDFNNDGFVNTADLLMFLTIFGTVC